MIGRLIKKYKFVIFLVLSFLILDFYIRNMNSGLGFISRFDLSPNLFTMSWILFFIGLIVSLPIRFRKYVYIVILFFYNLLLFVNIMYVRFFGNFFSFKNIGLAGEGKAYFGLVLNQIDIWIVLSIVGSICLTIVTCFLLPKERHKSDMKLSLVLLFLSLICYTGAQYFLGDYAPANTWNVWTYKRNIYSSYSDTRKSMQVSGFFEYIARDLYLAKIAPLFEDNSNQVKQVKKYLSNQESSKVNNRYKGIFKDKNLILVMMESVDSWIANEEYMPNLTKLMKSGINFTNHFAPIYNGGATFNTEFILNTGFMTPLNGESASSKYGRNYFPYSLANLFREEGYTANQIHENTGSFYNRGQMSSVFGYEHYYSSLDMGISVEEAVQDSHLLTNKKVKKLVIPNGKFMSYVITYSLHTPYSLSDIQCVVATTKSEKEQIKKGTSEEDICLKAQAKLADKFFEDLIDELKKQNKLDDTVIVGVTDHYAHAYTNRKKIYKLKNAVDENMLHKTPFFIWSNDIEAKEITKANSNLDVFPTIAYLFGLDYNPKYYIGNNILDDDYKGFVFFSDYSWYDGSTYYKNGTIASGKKVSKSYIDANNKKLNELLIYNENVLNSDYFRVMTQK